MNDQYDIENVKNKLIDMSKGKSFLSDSDLESLLPLDISVDDIEDLVSYLEESGIEIVHKKNDLNIFNRIRNIYPTDNSKACLTDDETEQILIDIKKVENNINDYKQQLINIEHRSPIPLNEFKNISLLIFLEEEKMRGLQEKIIKAHVPLLLGIVDQCLNTSTISLSKFDLLQEGYLRLMLAAREFKYNSDESFAVFASHSIRNGIDEALECDISHNIINEYIDNNIDMSTDPDVQYDRIGFHKKEKYQVNKKSKHSKVLLKTERSSTIENDLDLNNPIIIAVNEAETIQESISNKIIPLLNIPLLGEVTPTVTQEESLLSIKLKRATPKYRDISESKPLEQSFIDKLLETPESSQSLPSNSIPKLYSKLRFDNDRRLSRYAKQVGERGEEIVIKYLYETLPENEKSTIKWTSKRGETPGWDIEYRNSTNNLIAIEVKGTTGYSFPNVEITGNEWEAANRLRGHYWIYLVTCCTGTNPKIQRLQNPVELNQSGILSVTPMLWKIEMISRENMANK